MTDSISHEELASALKVVATAARHQVPHMRMAGVPFNELALAAGKWWAVIEQAEADKKAKAKEGDESIARKILGYYSGIWWHNWSEKVTHAQMLELARVAREAVQATE